MSKMKDAATGAYEKARLLFLSAEYGEDNAREIIRRMDKYGDTLTKAVLFSMAAVVRNTEDMQPAILADMAVRKAQRQAAEAADFKAAADTAKAAVKVAWVAPAARAALPAEAAPAAPAVLPADKGLPAYKGQPADKGNKLASGTLPNGERIELLAVPGGVFRLVLLQVRRGRKDNILEYFDFTSEHKARNRFVSFVAAAKGSFD